ncbi:hypothetical protein HWV62_5153 [Athelia sp. TMB]|nr:hypothetical protein HWV62_5153 [Athelia sp. TMB]
MEVLSSEFYDYRGADHASKQLGYYAKNIYGMTTVNLETPRSMRLAFNDSSSSGPEEAVLRIQGIIYKIIFPPKRRSMGRHGDSARFLEQSVTLVGGGSPGFSTAVDGIFNIAETLSRHDPAMAPWIPTTHEGQMQVTTGNRLFTWQREPETLQSIPVDPSIDPFGSISNLAGKEYVHTEENVVQFFKYAKDEDGTESYVPNSSSQFKPGDIVEAQCSFVVIPTRNGPNAMKLVLRALTMLDDSFSKASNVLILGSFAENSQAARIAGWKKTQTPITCITTSRTTPTKLTRRVGYSDYEPPDQVMDDISKRVKYMGVEDESGVSGSGHGR